MLSRFAVMPLFIIVLLNEISYQMIIPAMNHVINLICPQAEELVVSALYGAGIAAFTAAMMLGSPFMGYLSDKYGRKRILLMCILLMFLSALLFILSFYLKNIFYFLAARFLSGIAGASTAIVQAAIADRSFHRTRCVHFSVIGLALTIGLILGPLMGGYFVKGEAVPPLMLSAPFGVIALIAVVNLFLFAGLFKPAFFEKSNSQTPVNLKTYTQTAGILSVFFLLEFSWSLYYLTLPLLLQKSFLYDSRHISFFLSTIGLAMCLGLISYRFISRYFTPALLIKISFVVFITSLIGLIFSKNAVLNWLMIFPITWATALSYTAIMGLLSEKAASNFQGTAMGASLTVMALAWTITGFGAKFLFSIGDNSVLTFGICILALIIGVKMLSHI